MTSTTQHHHVHHVHSSSTDSHQQPHEAVPQSPMQTQVQQQEHEKDKDGPPVPVRESSLPLYQSAGLAGIYMAGSIVFFLCIRYSKERQKRNEGPVYDNASAVFFIEWLKWIFSVTAMYFRTGKFLPVSVFREKTWKIGVYYAVPSGIYALYNNLTFVNLRLFDPGTYQVFMQTRVLFTGVLYTYILKRALTQRKWSALVLLTVGVMAKYITFELEVDWRVSFMLFQASLSAFAGVYNEFLLKRDISMDVNEQNFFMYSFALFFNLGWGLISNAEYYVSGKVFANVDALFLFIVTIGATVGIVTSLILKFINVIVKAFASACEVLLTAILAAMFLNESLTKQDLVACSIVMASIYVYYTNPAAPPTVTSPAASPILAASSISSGKENSTPTSGFGDANDAKK